MESTGHIGGGMRSEFSSSKDENNGKVDSDEGVPFVSFECACCRVTEVSQYRAHSWGHSGLRYDILDGLHDFWCPNLGRSQVNWPSGFHHTLNLLISKWTMSGWPTYPFNKSSYPILFPHCCGVPKLLRRLHLQILTDKLQRFCVFVHQVSSQLCSVHDICIILFIIMIKRSYGIFIGKESKVCVNETDLASFSIIPLGTLSSSLILTKL